MHTPFVDGFIAKIIQGKEAEMLDQTFQDTAYRTHGQSPLKLPSLALYLCSDEASFITGCDYLIDGGL
ncbi:MAG: hypothetical protein R2822_14460 [Spirosomataceae bacterium]